MDRGFFLAVVVLAVLVNFIQGSAEDKPNVMRRTSLLEKLGMELHRDPHHHVYKPYKPYKKRCYCGPKRRYYRKGKGGSDSDSDSGSDSNSDSDNGGSPGYYRKYGKYKKYGGYRYRGNRSSDEE
ncbi:uncharacterized protein [Pocillopora verrucosa]|uniref:uncharacterized protein n=1 Tax=Pocillopora verrucosa TaxID=203993 RepID=UPI0033414A02